MFPFLFLLLLLYATYLLIVVSFVLLSLLIGVSYIEKLSFKIYKLSVLNLGLRVVSTLYPDKLRLSVHYHFLLDLEYSRFEYQPILFSVLVLLIERSVLVFCESLRDHVFFDRFFRECHFIGVLVNRVLLELERELYFHSVTLPILLLILRDMLRIVFLFSLLLDPSHTCIPWINHRIL